jgi:hypothetical protein
MLTYPSIQKLEATGSFETLVTIYQSTRRYIPVTAVRAWNLTMQFRRTSYVIISANRDKLRRFAVCLVCIVPFKRMGLTLAGLLGPEASRIWYITHDINWISDHFHDIMETEDSLPPQQKPAPEFIQTCPCFAMVKEKSERRIV